MPSALPKSMLTADPPAALAATGKEEPVIVLGTALPPSETEEGKLSPVPFPVDGD